MSESEELEYEEITSDEVDTIVATLTQLSEASNSETIRQLLDDCAASIYYLIYEDEDEIEEEIIEISNEAA